MSLRNTTPVPWYTLPLEVWFNIFKQAESLRQLSECRLVCKAWNPIAERAMFTQKLDLSRECTVVKFYDHLSKKPALGRLISHLNVSGIYDLDVAFQKKFFDLAFTPNIRVLDGIMRNESFGLLLEIVRKSPKKFSKLELLPNPYEYDDDYIKTLHCFKASLQALDIKIGQDRGSFDSVAKRLDEFVHLTKCKLVLNVTLDNIMELEKILKRCHHLKYLEVSMCSGVHFAKILDTKEMQRWLSANIEKVQNVKNLVIDYGYCPHIVEYLMHKYPNVQSLDFGSYAEIVGYADRILNSIKHVTHIYLHGWYLNDMEELKNFVEAMKSKKNTITMKFNPGDEDCIAEMNATKNRLTDCTDFIIYISVYKPPTVFDEILSLFDTITDLDIDIISHRSTSFYSDDDRDIDMDLTDHAQVGYTNRSAIHLQYLLNSRPEIEQLKFSDSCVVSLDYRLEPLEKLKSLELRGVLIKEQVFSSLSRKTPNLRHLTLDSCILDDSRAPNQEIILPESRLTSLTLSVSDLEWGNVMFGLGEPSDDNYYDHDARERMHIHQGQLVYIKISNMSSKRFPVQYYAVKSGDTFYQALVSKHDYENDACAKIAIECLSLQVLNIDLGELAFKMQFDADGQLKELTTDV